MSGLRDGFKKLTGDNCKVTSSYDVENCSDLNVKMFNPRYVDWLERRLANGVDTGEEQCNIAVVSQQRELLNALADSIEKEFEIYAYMPDLIKHIKSFNGEA